MRKVLAITAVAMLLLSGVALADHVFPDVRDDHTHHHNIGWAHDRGVVVGFEDGRFRPNDNITRGQAATMFAQYHESTFGVEDLVWHAIEVDATLVDPAGNELDPEAEELPPAGTRYIFSEDLYEDEERTTQVGNNVGVCTIVTAGGEAEEDFFLSTACEGVVNVTGVGDLSWQSSQDFPTHAESVKVTITGGSEALLGASGEVLVEFVDDPDELLSTYNIRLRVPDND
jgi:hypothetical protein